MNLHDILSASYADREKQKKELAHHGYKYDSMLSNHNQQVYWHPENRKLLTTVAGTHNLNDWLTDASLAVGRLKNTARYHEADKALKEAKQKYGVDKAIVAGHSLGGSIASYIASKGDDVYTLNKGATIGQKTRSNEHGYRTAGDIVSLANANAKHMTTLNTGHAGILENAIKSTTLGSAVNPIVGVANAGANILSSHGTDSIKDANIYVD